MNDKTIITIVGMLCVCAVLLTAIAYGYNHTLQTLGIGAICAFGGVGVGFVKGQAGRTSTYRGLAGETASVTESTDSETD